ADVQRDLRRVGRGLRSAKGQARAAGAEGAPRDEARRKPQTPKGKGRVSEMAAETRSDCLYRRRRHRRRRWRYEITKRGTLFLGA
ncbi:unnamed protein product, partial [Laminaria digitata]